MRKQNCNNELGYLTDEQYKKTFRDCGDGTNFMNLESPEVISRALVTFMWECNYLKDEVIEDNGRMLDLFLAIQSAISEGSLLELRAAVGPIREPLQALFDHLDECADD